MDCDNSMILVELCVKQGDNHRRGRGSSGRDAVTVPVDSFLSSGVRKGGMRTC